MSGTSSDGVDLTASSTMSAPGSSSPQPAQAQPLPLRTPRSERSTTSNNNHNNRKGRRGSSSFPGEAALRRMVQEAKYELTVDPYRGMMMLTQATATLATTSNNDGEKASPTPALSPWEAQCRWTEPTPVSPSVVESICHCQCPSLIRWTEQRLKQKKRGRRRNGGIGTTTASAATGLLGARPTDPTVRCLCDYNPFCLSSLGGAMDQVWEEQQRVVRMQRDSSNTSGKDAGDADGGDDDSSDEVIVVSPNGKEQVTNPAEDRLQLSFDPSVDLDKTIYSRKTLTDLRNLRGSVLVDRTKIVDYLKNTLQDLTSVVSIDTCLECIETWHRQLLYVNPLREQPSCPEDQLRMALPPGIENLGATCYLNTQLQCLAQITVFLDGIFTWQPPVDKENDNNKKVQKVLATFQRVLANLYMGSHRTTTTVEFSNALELDHFEQQDPNEFSRLFLDLMHNSFQKEAASPSSSDNGGHTTSPLPGLLPHLFQGTIQNITICQQCSSHSSREEAFMDLNLPITAADEGGASSPAGKRPKKAGIFQTTLISDFFMKKGDPDVQQFLDRYCQDEVLDGDNQYLCDRCGCKQDAIRRVRFTKLPSLLNIQLSRYIFDMKTMSKKKVTDKVLLPRKITVSVESGDSVSSSSSETKAYLLCAVMIHKGKSAFSGHYVAQAMDWITGSWFEFNDTEVKILKDGPDCSFHQQDGKAAGKVVGSQDAYNLYYVEEGFLAGSVMERMKNLQKHSNSSSPMLAEMVNEREKWYKGLNEACVMDLKSAERLKLRRDLITKELFCTSQPLETLAEYTEPPPVWVPGSFLRRFFSCRDTFEDELAGDIVGDVIKSSESLCAFEEKGLHPRVARRGKLLPRVMYEMILDVLREERKALMDGREIQTEEEEDGFVISPSEGMFCQESVNEYRANLRPRVRLLENCLFLFDELLTNTFDEPLEYEAGPLHESEQEAYVYVVSKKFCTSLREHIKKIMKQVAHSDTESFAVDEKLMPHLENVAEGIDVFKLEELELTNTSSNIDIEVNGNLTCPHGSLKRYNKNQVRYVSSAIWNRIKQLCPTAIEHKVQKRSSDTVEAIEVFNPCDQCESSSTLAENLVKDLCLLAESAASLKLSTCDPDDVLLSETGETFRVVHKNDEKSVSKFVRTFRNYSSKEAIEKIRQDALRCFGLDEISKDGSEKGPTALDMLNHTDQRILTLMRKLIQPVKCKEHRLPVKGVMTISSPGSPPSLSAHFDVVPENTYRDYVLFVFSLSRLLVLSENGLDIDFVDEENGTSSKDAEKFCSTHEVFDWHPDVRAQERGLDEASDQSVTYTKGEASTYLHLKSLLCDYEKCRAKLEEANLQCSKEPKTSNNSQKSRGTEPGDPIVIDVDMTVVSDSNMFTLTVLEAEPSASERKIADSVSQYTGIPLAAERDTTFLAARRSSRRRRTCTPTGALISEDTMQADICNNIAALRLGLLETLSDSYDLHHRLFLVVSPVDTKAEPDAYSSKPDPQIVSLDFSKNQMTLLEVAEKAMNGDVSLIVPKDSLVLVRQPIGDDSVEGIEQATLMDELIGLSNAAAKDPKDKKSRSRAVERGFTGTLLSSASTNNASCEEAKGEKEDKVVVASEGDTCTALVVVDTNKSVKDHSTVPVSPPQGISSPESDQSAPKRRKTSHDPEDMVLVEEDRADVVKDTEMAETPPVITVEDGDSSRLVMAVLDELQKRLGEKKDMSAIFEASAWAVEQDQSTDKAHVIETAMVKYYDLTIQ